MLVAWLMGKMAAKALVGILRHVGIGQFLNRDFGDCQGVEIAHDLVLRASCKGQIKLLQFQRPNC